MSYEFEHWSGDTCYLVLLRRDFSVPEISGALDIVIDILIDIVIDIVIDIDIDIYIDIALALPLSSLSLYPSYCQFI